MSGLGNLFAKQQAGQGGSWRPGARVSANVEDQRGAPPMSVDDQIRGDLRAEGEALERRAARFRNWVADPLADASRITNDPRQN